MKKGASHVDWAISMSIFLVYVLLMFIFLKPGSQPVYNENTLLNIVYSGLKDDTTSTVQRGYLMITPKIDIDHDAVHYIRIRDGSKYLNSDWTRTENLIHLTLVNESLGTAESKYVKDEAFDLVDEKYPGEEVLDLYTRLKGKDEINFFWFLYSDEVDYNHPTAPITWSDADCQAENPPGTRTKNCLLNDGPTDGIEDDDFTYEFGVIETYSGFSQEKINSLNTSYPESTTNEQSEGYKALKKMWGFPEDKNFKINITEVSVAGYNQALNPEPGINVYVMEQNMWFIDERGYLTPGKITIALW